MSDKHATASDTRRRNFLRVLASASGAAAAMAALNKLEASPETAIAEYEKQIQALAANVDPTSLDVLERMRRELVEALKKPVEQRRWVMVIDLRKCIGCHACTIGCVAENKLPPGVVYRPVLDEEIGTYPNVTRRFLPRPCMQCDNPPCTAVCPVSATYKNDDGVVVIDYNQCIGCRYCITACPYAARTFDFGYTYTSGTADGTPFLLGRDRADDYERAANHEYGTDWERTGADGSPIGNVRKCHFCMHRVKEGMLPSCVTTCVGRATMFGDANNPDGLVAQMIAKPNVMRLKEEMGTQPRVFYLL